MSLAMKALEHDPTDVYPWVLMMRSLSSIGRVDDAALIGWEAVRRFPENVQWRTQLAGILADNNGDDQLAARLLEETICLFPENLYARAQLATVLADDLRRVDDARSVLTSAIDELGDNKVIRSLLTKLDRGLKLRGDSPKRIRNGDTSNLTWPTATMRRRLFLFEAEMETKDTIRSFIKDTGRGAYETYVAERMGLSDIPIKTTFALAFDHALRKAEAPTLRNLILNARPLERGLLEKAIAESEGRVVEFSAVWPDAEKNERLRTLEKVLNQKGGTAQRRTLLLRDFAASTLSTNFLPLAA